MNVKKRLQKVCSAILIFSMAISMLPSVAFGAGSSVVTAPVSEKTETTAVLRGSFILSGIDTISDIKFLVSTTSKSDTASARDRDLIEGTTFKYNLSDLTAGTEYFVRTVATFNKGTGTEYQVTGNEVSFVTNGASIDTSVTVSSPTFTNNAATSVTAQSRYKVTGYNVVSAGFAFSDTLTEPEIGNSRYIANQYSSSESSFSETLSNLSPNKRYYVRGYVTYRDSNNNTITKYSSREDYTSSVVEDTNVVTTNADYEDSFLKVRGRVKDFNSSNVYEEGFVYSSSNSVPTLGDSKYVAHNSSSTRSEFEGNISVSSSADTYYVRAYASADSFGTAYGKVIKVAVASALPTVVTNHVSDVNADSAYVSINVTDNGDYNISERGVVYSKTMSLPELNVDKSNNAVISGSSGTGNTTITGLDQNTRYYIRAYAKNSVGTAYGETRDFTTLKNATVQTEMPTDIKANSILAKGTILSENGYSIQERGFVYSRDKKVPTYDDYRATVQSNVSNPFTLEMTNLNSSSTFYIRAFVKTSQGLSYGDTLSFVTLNPYVGVKISYKSLEGVTISSEEIDGSNVTKLDSSHLTIPYGYVLYDANWSYEVKTSDNIIAVILKPDTSVERAFMVGTSRYTFSPDTPIRRVEVAEMIYNLQGGTGTGLQSSYTDVPATLSGNNAISYVSSKGYMQGYPEGTFKPNNTITRAELAVVLCKVFGLQGTGTSNMFTDSANHWGRSYINIAAENNIISGYPGGLFKPDGTTTRAEACKLFSSSSQRSLTPLGTEEFTDVPGGHWAYQYIMNAAVPK